MNLAIELVSVAFFYEKKISFADKNQSSMKYSNEITINIPFSKMIQLFENPENLKKWQPDVVSFERVSGEIGQPGAVSKMKVDMKVKVIEMKEIILERNLPSTFKMKYEADGVTNIVTNSFREVSADQTYWKMHNDFRFQGIMKYAALALKGIFKKQTLVTMERFKKFAESLPKEEV